MMFALGLIVGILLVLAILVVEQRNRRYKPSNLLSAIQTSANRRQRGEVILPPDEATEAREKIIKEKHDAGLPVFIDDLP